MHLGFAAIASRLLRMRFDRVEHVPLHFHPGPGGRLFFYPHPVALPEGTRVTLEIGFAVSEQICALRGTIKAHQSGAPRGCWIEFPPTLRVERICSTAVPTRAHRRYPADLLVRIDRGSGLDEVCRVTDLSLSGARVAGASALALGASVELTLITSAGSRLSLGTGSVQWTQPSEAGLRFDRCGAPARRAISDAVESARTRLSVSPEINHASFCGCASGDGVFVPPLPRAIHRGSELLREG